MLCMFSFLLGGEIRIIPINLPSTSYPMTAASGDRLKVLIYPCICFMRKKKDKRRTTLLNVRNKSLPTNKLGWALSDVKGCKVRILYALKGEGEGGRIYNLHFTSLKLIYLQSYATTSIRMEGRKDFTSLKH